MVHVVYGSDTFTAREVVRELLASAATEAADADAVDWIDGRSATQEEILHACGQVSMFGDTRRVVVEGLLSRFGKGDSRARQTRGKGRRRKTGEIGEWAQFAEQVQLLTDRTLLILLDEDVGKANPLLDALTSVAAVRRLDPPKGVDLLRWIHDRVGLHDARIERDAADRLAMLVGSDLWQLDSEIRKLATYCADGPITMGVVDDMLTAATAPSIFMLVDAIVERNERLARRRLEDMHAKGLSAGYVLTMVARQIRLIALLVEARGRRSSGTQQLPGDLAALQPFALQRATQQSQRYNEPQVRNALIRLREADRAIKTGLLDDKAALDVLITNLLRTEAA